MTKLKKHIPREIETEKKRDDNKGFEDSNLN
jgi:hypothetical protein